tara:strand:+ start:42 stop:467 length:426 start_codon:yes stop_codon:yes gene_type:complete
MHIKLTNGTPVKYTLGQLRRDNPNTSFPKVIPDEMLASYDVYSCTRLERPAYDHLTEQCFDAGFEQDAEGNWVQGYSVEPVEQEVAERNVRSKRDRLLSDTDWMALSDVTMTPDWATYRQALRDITGQSGFPHSVVWPTKT